MGELDADQTVTMGSNTPASADPELEVKQTVAMGTNASASAGPGYMHQSTGPPSFSVGQIVRRELTIIAVGLAIACFPFVASEFVSAFAIPSRSMDATLKIGDLVLAEKLSPILKLPLEPGDLVLFAPPREHEDIVAKEGWRTIGRRDRFVKRVAAVAGDVVQVGENGRSVRINDMPRPVPTLACPATAAAASPPSSGCRDDDVTEGVAALVATGKVDDREAAALLREVAPPERETAIGAVEEYNRRARQRIFGNVEDRAIDPQQLVTRTTIAPGFVFVLGDCEQSSTDSRYWGPLPIENVDARPVVRIWPPERVGAIETTEDLNPFRRQALRFKAALNDAIRLERNGVR